MLEYRNSLEQLVVGSDGSMYISVPKEVLKGLHLYRFSLQRGDMIALRLDYVPKVDELVYVKAHLA